MIVDQIGTVILLLRRFMGFYCLCSNARAPGRLYDVARFVVAPGIAITSFDARMRIGLRIRINRDPIFRTIIISSLDS